MIQLREATQQDVEAIRSVHSLAFGQEEAEAVAELACELLDETGTRPTLSLVAESGGHVVAHVAFSPVAFATSCPLQGYLLAPLGVTPNYQKQGIGSRLVNEGVRRLRGAGTDVVLVYGDPAYYGRFGFTTEHANGFNPPYELQHAFGWQAAFLGLGNPPSPPTSVSCVPPLRDASLW